MTPMRIYRAASLPIKRQLWLTVAVCLVAAFVPVSARGGDEARSAADWVTPQNLLSIAILVYGVGTLVQQLNDVRRRLEKAEAAHQALTEKTLPETYARKDVIVEQLAALRALIEQQPPSRQQQWRDAHGGTKE